MLKRPRRSPWPGAIAFILGVAWAYANLEDVRQVVDTRRWPTAPGVVIESRMSHDTEPNVPRLSKARRSIVTRFHIRYVYTIDGREYSGTRLSLLPRTGRPDSRSLVARYPNHVAVTVHYDVYDPTTAVIDTSIPTSSVVHVILGGAVAAFGLWFLMRRFRH